MGQQKGRNVQTNGVRGVERTMNAGRNGEHVAVSIELDASRSTLNEIRHSAGIVIVQYLEEVTNHANSLK